MTADKHWHKLSPEQVLKQCQSAATGLAQTEAEQRLAQYGPNTLETVKRPSWLSRLLLQFHNVLIYTLLVAAVITGLLQLWADTIMIAGVAVVNAIIGFIQESKAEKALLAIQQLLAPTATVLRDGVRVTVPASQLVVGDIVLLASGDKVPADLRILKSKSLRVDEALLTGESVPVSKHPDAVPEKTPLSERYCMLYAGTGIVYGTAQAMVVETGKATEIGRIGALLKSVPKLTTPLLRQLSIFARRLVYIIVVFAIIALAYGYFVRQMGFGETFASAVALAVAAIPEGLPAILTIILAVAVMRMARLRAIVRRLPAIETLSSVTTICTDKTGTLTRNEMMVQTIVTPELTYEITGSGYQPSGQILHQNQLVELAEQTALNQIILAGLLCNDAQLIEQDGEWRLHGDPVDGALLAVALKAQHDLHQHRQSNPLVDTIPFESEHKFMATLHRRGDSDGFIYVKGAPETILPKCHRQYPDVPIVSDYWQQALEQLTSQGQRVIAIAMKRTHPDKQQLSLEDVSTEYTLLGLIGLLDSPREEAKRAVHECRQAGIQVKMITGDHAATAKAVAQAVGIDTKAGVMTGDELTQLSERELPSIVKRINVFARTLPEHKIKLVKALQATGQTVAMTGDGVNDSPALKLANVGIAMGKKGTEAAKEASEIVLADDNFATLEHAVREGRTVYNNLKKAIFFILPTNAAEALAVFIAILFGITLPITPVQILWVNMITAVTLAIALAFEPTESDVMQQPPRDPREPLFSRLLTWRIVYVSILLLLGVFGLYAWQHFSGASLATSRAVAVNTLVFGEIAYVFNSRRLRRAVWGLSGFFGNKIIWIAIAVVIGFQAVITYVPPLQEFFGMGAVGITAWLAIVGFAVVLFLCVELEKWLSCRRQQKHQGHRHA